jgi:hypothetical protein
VQSSAVVPEQPIDGLVLRLRLVTKRCPCSRSTFNEPNSVSLQALSQQLPLRLIEAGDAVFREHVPEVVTCVLAASVAVEDQSGLLYLDGA